MRASALLALFGGATFIALSPIWVRLADVGPTASAFWRVALAAPLLWAALAVAPRAAAAQRADARLLVAAEAEASSASFHLIDVNGDQYVSSHDVLRIVNALNAEAEGGSSVLIEKADVAVLLSRAAAATSGVINPYFSIWPRTRLRRETARSGWFRGS